MIAIRRPFRVLALAALAACLAGASEESPAQDDERMRAVLDLPVESSLRGFISEVVLRLSYALPPGQRVELACTMALQGQQPYLTPHVQLPVERRTLRQALDAIAAQAGLRWRVAPACIVIDQAVPAGERRRLADDYAEACDRLARATAADEPDAKEVEAAKKALMAAIGTLGKCPDADVFRPLLIDIAAGKAQSDQGAWLGWMPCAAVFAADSELRDLFAADLKRGGAHPEWPQLLSAARLHVPGTFETCLALIQPAQPPADAGGQQPAPFGHPLELNNVFTALGILGDLRAVEPIGALVIKPDALGPGAAQLRISMISTLGNLADARSVDLLVRCLRSRRPELHGIAATALGRIGGEEALAALREAADSGDPNAMNLAVQELANNRDPQALAVALRVGALGWIGPDLLGRIGGPEAVQALKKRLVTTGDRQQYRLNLAALAGMDEPEAHRALAESIPKPSNDQLVEHLSALVDCQDEAATAALLDQLSPRRDPALRRAAAFCLARAGEAGARRARELAERDADIEVRRAAVIGFIGCCHLPSGRFGCVGADERLLPAATLLDWLRAGSAEVRQAAAVLAEVVAEHRADLADLEPVKAAIRADQDSPLRVLAGVAAGTQVDVATLTLPLIDLALAPDADLRLAAIQNARNFMLAGMSPPKVVGAVADALADLATGEEGVDVRVRAAERLIELGQRYQHRQVQGYDIDSRVKRLTERLRRGDADRWLAMGRVRTIAIRLLAQSRDAELEQKVVAMIAAAGRDGDADLLKAILDVAGQMQDRGTLPALAALLAPDVDAGIRLAVARRANETVFSGQVALAKPPSPIPEFASALAKAAKDDPEPQVRAEAANSLLKMVRYFEQQQNAVLLKDQRKMVADAAEHEPDERVRETERAMLDAGLKDWWGHAVQGWGAPAGAGDGVL